MSFVDVAVPIPLAHALTYRVPGALEAQVGVGSRVLVELGRRRVMGVALARHGREPAEGVRVKELLDVVEREPVVPGELLRFVEEVARYYFAPVGEVLRLALPGVERGDAERLEGRGHGEAVAGQVVGGRRVRFAAPTERVEEPGTLRGQALFVLHYLRANGPTPLARLEERWKSARAAVRKLVERGLAQVDERELPRDPFFREPAEPDRAPEPTGAQRAAMAAIDGALGREGGGAFLLHGVTGSGKTEVYLHAVATARARGRGVLILVPEIALTPQLVSRYRARFGDGLAVLHSGLGDRDRHGMWRALRSGEVSVAIGARSALFAPIPDLGLVVVDEEHDPSFKQEEGVRYQARDMALLRARRAGATCVLGSATPSLESEHLSRTGKLERLVLPARARSEAVLPQVVTIDLRTTGPGPSGDRRISLPLHRRLAEVLARGEQAILFLNRRGFAPSVVCEACGSIAMCKLCSVALTYHRGGRLRCHYCDHEEAHRDRCYACRSDKLALEGAGTERLEETVARAFPGARVARIDRDVAAGARAEAVFERLRRREIDILIGTQMVAKGHDLPDVTLVGVINADAALSMPDFRASERTFQLLVQVAGRAGRAERKGTVLLQTRDPSHAAVALAKEHDVEGFADRELRLRAELGYPPFSRLALVRVDAHEEAPACEAAEALARVARHAARARPGDVDVLGPAPAPLSRLRGRYRYRVLLKARARPPLRAVLFAVAEALPRVGRQARVIVDVDPVSML
ncbi:MAG TPA: primosomal protein N' [Polyangiaceae bacterium]|nr:primosomal protein N' [Polyangiaceae bacterium]